MKKAKLTVTLLIFIYSLLHVISANAAERNDFSKQIFNFQKKLAISGNTEAQYRLGTFYEFGVSVKPNANEAAAWYRKSSKKNYKPAANRLTYLEIKQTGYVKSKHADWLKSVREEVKSSEPNALILYGEMHRHGVVVGKNLNQALTLLHKASALGNTEVDSEIQEIENEIIAKKRKHELTRKKQRELEKQKQIKNKEKAKTIARNKQKEKRKREKRAKRLKYEKAMRKLRQEELLLQQQQEWSEGETE